MKDFIRPSILSSLNPVDKNDTLKPEPTNNVNEETTRTVEEEHQRKKDQKSRKNILEEINWRKRNSFKNAKFIRQSRNVTRRIKDVKEELTYCSSLSSSSCNTTRSAFELKVISVGVATSLAKGEADRL